MKMERTQIGELSAVLTGQLKSPQAMVVLCHGYGASGDDLVGIGDAILSQFPDLAESTMWVFPEAPLSLDVGPYSGRAWWHLNVAALAEAVERGELSAVKEAFPPGIERARSQLSDLVEQLLTTHNLSHDRLVLGGFSQGAMLATDVALHLDHKPALLVVYSGSLICRSEWSELAVREPKFRVFQSHGTVDPILAPAMGDALRLLLEESGHDVTFQSFHGGHTIPMEAIAKLADEVRTLVSV